MFDFWQSTYLKESSKYLLAEINDLSINITREDYPKAKQSMGQINKTWEKMKTGWNIFGESRDIEDISIYISKLEVQVDNESKMDAITTYTLLKREIENVLLSESLNFANIF